MSLQHMLYYKIIALIDIFQYSNVYGPMPSITSIVVDRDLQKRCLEYVACRHKHHEEEGDFDMCIEGAPNPKNHSEPAPVLKQLNPMKTMSVYSELTSGLKVSEFIAKFS